ncbi:MAG: VanZ family protein [Phycisphaerales bacterium]|nr:MAG: VanZ family protein [Phycisphaerales bacterium]
MALSHQRKTTAILLALYWPTLFVFAHIPVPQVVQEADVSDKSLHFLAYLILVYLLWFSMRGGERVSWRGMGAWCVLAALAVYGVFDEWSQGFVAGRSCDVRDFFADMTGVLAGLILFSVFTFLSAGLLVVAIVIFGVTNVTRADLGELMPIIGGTFYLFSYAIFTALWVQYIRHFRFTMRPPRTGIRHLTAALAAPLALLLFVKLFSVVFDSAFGAREMIICACGIGAVIAATYLAPSFRRAKG